jgi:mannose-6-phosphate isomerase-like protein (cupin superfamily)
MLLPSGSGEIAPDGSIVRALLRVPSASMAHFELAAGGTSRAVMHESVDELWFVLSGRGELWRKQDAREEVVALQPGACVTIPQRTHFQFRAFREDAVTIIAATIPGWPGDAEAKFVPGPWQHSVTP